ncbi:hypothetical protein [Nocardia terpenica]|nr:hypothetical protein [Nocardia terpenica]
MTIALVALGTMAAIETIRFFDFSPDWLAYCGELAGITAAGAVCYHVVTARSANLAIPVIIITASIFGMSVAAYLGFYSYRHDMFAQVYQGLICSGMLLAGGGTAVGAIRSYGSLEEGGITLILLSIGGILIFISGLIGFFHLQIGYPEMNGVGWLFNVSGFACWGFAAIINRLDERRWPALA